MSYDFKVQRGEEDFGSVVGADTKDVTITSVGSLSSAFAFLRSTQNSSSGTSSTVTVNKNSDDLSMSCLLTSVSNVRLTRTSAAEDVNYQGNWEVWEYIGDSGGPNEFIVREHVAVAMGATVATVTRDISSLNVSDYTKLVPIVCGYAEVGTGVSWNQRPTLRIDTSGQDLILERTDTTVACTVYYALVEFTGSNWQVVQNVSHTYSLSGTDETETITSIVDWDTAFIFSSHHTDQVGLDEVGWTVRPGSSVTTVRFRMRSGATILTDERTIAFVVRNENCAVTHEDSITGSQSELSSLTVSTAWTIAALSNPITAAGVLGSADCAGTGVAYPRPWWAYDLSSTTSVGWRRGRSGQASDAVVQVIEFPQRVVSGDVDSSAGAATISINTDKLDQLGQLAVEFPGGGNLDLTDGTNSAVDIDSATGHTFEVWFYFDALPPGGTATVTRVFGRYDIFLGKRYRLDVSDLGSVTWEVVGGAGSTLITYSEKVETGRWYQAICEADFVGEEVSLRLSSSCVLGDRETATITNLSPNSGGPVLRWGVEPNVSNSGMDGAVCRWRKWDGVLGGSTNAASLYYSGKGRMYGDLPSPWGASHGNLEVAWEMSEEEDGSARRDFIGGLLTVAERLSRGGVGGAICADAATTTISAQRLVQGAVVADAGNATVTIDADEIKQTDVAVEADSAVVTIDADEIKQTDVAVEADSAVVTISAVPITQAPQLAADFVRTRKEILNGGTDSAFDFSGLSAYTIEIWIRPDGATVEEIIFSRWGSGQEQCALTWDGTSFRFYVNTVSAGTITDVLTLSVDPDEEWVALYLVYSGTYITMAGWSRNSSASNDQNATFSSIRTSTEDFILGWRNVLGTAGFQGRVQRFRRWDRQLNNNEMRDLIQLGSYPGGGIANEKPLYGTTYHELSSAQLVSLVFSFELDELNPDAGVGALNPVHRQDSHTSGAQLLDLANDLGATRYSPSAPGRRTCVLATAAETIFDAQKIVQGSVVAEADPATTAIDGDVLAGVLITGDVVADAGNATVAIDADEIKQTSVAVEASPATTLFDAQKRMHTSMVVQADPAATIFDAQKISQTDVAVDADTAVVAIDADEIKQTSVAVGADTAVVAIDASYVRFASAVAVEADTAVVAIDADEIKQTTMTVAADPATTAISAQRRMHVSMTVEAGPATTVIDAQKIHQVAVAVDADTSIVTIDASEIKHTSMTVEAGDAVAAIDADEIKQATMEVEADPATTLFDAQKISQTDVAVEADPAVVAIDADEIKQTDVAAEADPATSVFDAQKRMHVSMTVEADPATTVISGEIVGAISGGVIADAGDAVATVATQKVSTSAVTVSAGAANTVFGAQKITQGAVAVEADPATAAIHADRVVQTDVAVEADPATVVIPAQRIEAVDVSVSADHAVTVIPAQKLSQTSPTVQASPAATAIPAQKIHVVDVAVQADPATTSIDGTILQSTGIVIAEAGAANTLFDAQKVVQTPGMLVFAGAATTAIPAQRVEQVSFATEADPATSFVLAQRLLGTSLTLSAGEAQGAVLGQRVVQGVVQAVTDPATALALGSALQVQGSVTAQAGLAITVALGQRLSQTVADVFAGLATVQVPVQRISQTDMAVFADHATAFVVAFDPARAVAPSIIFGPDLVHAVVSPPLLTLVTVYPTEYLVTRKMVETVLVEAQVSEVVSAADAIVFETETEHRVIFRPPR